MIKIINYSKGFKYSIYLNTILEWRFLFWIAYFIANNDLSFI